MTWKTTSILQFFLKQPGAAQPENARGEIKVTLKNNQKPTRQVVKIIETKIQEYFGIRAK